FLRQREEGIPLAHRLPLAAVDLLHLPRRRSLHRHLHFHRLEDDARLPFGDRIPLFHFDLPHRSGDVREDVLGHGGCTVTFAWPCPKIPHALGFSTSMSPPNSRAARRLAPQGVCEGAAKPVTFPRGGDARTPDRNTMAEQKESSVLFSLKELMNLEEDRIRQEEQERQRAAQREI